MNEANPKRPPLCPSWIMEGHFLDTRCPLFHPSGDYLGQLVQAAGLYAESQAENWRLREALKKAQWDFAWVDSFLMDAENELKVIITEGT